MQYLAFTAKYVRKSKNSQSDTHLAAGDLKYGCRMLLSDMSWRMSESNIKRSSIPRKPGEAAEKVVAYE